MYGPQIRLCLFTFWPIALKELNNLTTIDTLSWLGGAEVTQTLLVREVLGSMFMLDFLFCCGFFYFFVPKQIILSQKFAISFAILIYLIYITYCKICDRL